MRTIQISRFQATCPAELERVATTGEPLLVTRYGKPVARVVPASGRERKSWLGAMKGTGKIVGDIVSPVADLSEWEVLR